MLSRQKVADFLREHFDDTASEKDRLIKEFLIQLEFGAFDADDDDYEEDNAFDDA